MKFLKYVELTDQLHALDATLKRLVERDRWETPEDFAEWKEAYSERQSLALQLKKAK